MVGAGEPQHEQASELGFLAASWTVLKLCLLLVVDDEGSTLCPENSTNNFCTAKALNHETSATTRVKGKENYILI